jgi:hypothetical protein
MAENDKDRAKWLAGLSFYRKEIEKNPASTRSKLALKRMKSFEEPLRKMSPSAKDSPPKMNLSVLSIPNQEDIQE